MGYDGCQVYVNTADVNDALPFPCRVHRVEVEHADGSAVLSVQLHDAATVSGPAKVSCTTNLAYNTTFQRQAANNYPCGVNFDKRVSVNITGTGTYRIYYTPR
jgi:hypothetical protein